MQGLGGLLRVKMKLLFNHCRHLVTDNSFSTIIWALHFGCRELFPLTWVGGYNQKGKLLDLRVNTSFLRALVLEISLVDDR